MSKDIEWVASQIVDAAYVVHKTFGPGLLESTYKECHTYELKKRGIAVENEVPVPLFYDGRLLDATYRIDSFVEKLIIVEHKTVEQLLPIHEAQLLTYLKLSNVHLGFLINWNVVLIKHGIKRMVYRLPEPIRKTSLPSK